MTTTDAELDALVAALKSDFTEWDCSTTPPTLRADHSAPIPRHQVAAALREENRTLGQLLAHVHWHLTSDENFDADELLQDIKSAAGEWVDTETILGRLREENDRLRTELDAACKVVEKIEQRSRLNPGDTNSERISSLFYIGRWASDALTPEKPKEDNRKD